MPAGILHEFVAVAMVEIILQVFIFKIFFSSFYRFETIEDRNKGLYFFGEN